MNADEFKKADEVVRAMRDYASDCDACCDCFRCDFACVCGQFDYNAPRIIADLIESLTAQLSASQRREKAAVEDAKQGSMCRTCHYLNDGCEPLNLDAGCSKWQWRGPQEAEKGEADGN